MSLNRLASLAHLLDSDPLIAGSVAEAWEKQTIPQAIPSGWVDFTQSEVCLEIYCVCGMVVHAVSQIQELVMCGVCKRKYFLNGHIQLIEVITLPDKEYVGN